MGSDSGDGKIKVFVSSTFLDNEERRKVVDNAIRRADMTMVGMEWFEASARPTVEYCQTKPAECDVFVGIIAWRYGWIPEGLEISITELEYNAAKTAGIPRLMFVLDESVPVLPNRDYDLAPDRWAKQGKLEQFKLRFAADQMPAAPFQDNTLGAEVLDSLIKWRDGPRISQSPSGSNLDAQIKLYLTKGIAQYESISLAGFETKVRVPIRLEELYVPLDAMVDLRVSDSEVPFNCAEEAEGLRHEDINREVSLAEAFECAETHGERRGIVILGDPGSGKTTQLKRLFLAVANEGPEKWGLPAGTVPVFLPLRNLKDSSGNLRKFIESELSDPVLDLPEDFGRRLIERGRLLLLLDGLDEVIDAGMRAEVSRWIESARVTAPDSCFAVTCRYAGYTGEVRLDEQFLEMHLRPLDEDQASTFIYKWFRIVETSMAKDKAMARVNADKKAGELWADLQDSEIRASARVFSMTRNPLLLTTICLVHRDRGQLPRKRAELYDECINVLLERWQTAKEISISIPAKSARQVLQPAAYWMHGEQGRTRATEEELTPVIEPLLKEVEDISLAPQEFLGSIRDESGLLTGWSGDSYGFMHLGFQEYLAAREIRSRSFEEPEMLKGLAERIGESWWREVALLSVALEDPPIFEGLMRYVVETVEFPKHLDIVRQCLNEAGRVSIKPFLELLARPAGEDLELWARQYAALSIIAGWDREKAIGLVTELRDHPSPIIQSWLRSRDSAAGKETIVSQPSGVELVRIPGGKFLMGSPEGEEGRYKNEGPQREVTISDFYMGRHAVTNEAYGRYLKANPEVKVPRYWSDSEYNQPRQPVVGVSWDEARAYCKWAGLRLPTEAEWEYACRAGTTTRFWSGDTEEDLARVGWYGENSGNKLHPVGEKEPSAFGLYDIHGNIFEWCADGWGSHLPRRMLDPFSKFHGIERVIRGGSFIDRIDRDCRSAFRTGCGPSGGVCDVGFRLVLAPTSESSFLPNPTDHPQKRVP
ncbi:MAG: SUMF1/EgtB/PvdO family nonheme iron enzyme [Deltaproteobacteria bacterium]|nr:SUMF1/EgtB/PvdO family nonheme iron enzyme [Deltaproteobacteria bacterium]